MRKKDKLKILEQAAEDFRTTPHVRTIGERNIEACTVWYKPGESINYGGTIVGAGSNKFYEGAQRYIVRWDEEKRLPASEVIDNRAKQDLCLVRAIESAVLEVLTYINAQSTKSK